VDGPSKPLAWRSILNPVWAIQFRRWLGETPNGFRHMGAVATHPELLDWLASTFRDQGQSLKQLHRLIVTSATYQQQSQGATTAADSAALDRENRYLWRQTRPKLRAAAIRD